MPRRRLALWARPVLRTRALAGALVALPGGALAGQRPTVERLAAPPAPRWTFGVAVDVARPVGDLRRHVHHGWGGEGHLVYHVDRAGVLALRADAGRLAYGRTRSHVAFASAGGAQLAVDLRSTNDVWWAGVGPQLAVPVGPVRPYAVAQAGAARFATTLALRDRGGGVVREVAQEDAALAWSAGGGLLVLVGRRAALDVGARHQRTGRVGYVPEGGVRELAAGGVAVDVVRGPAALWTYRVGLAVRFDARDLDRW